MRQTAEFDEDVEVDDLPPSPLLVRQRSNPYGSIADLSDEELADPDELERQAFATDWEPVLALPVEPRRHWIHPNIDENGKPDWGAFGTVDFDRIRPAFNKARYKAERLNEQLKDVLIMLSIVKERLVGKAKYLVLKYVNQGIIELEHIENQDMLGFARLYLRAQRLRSEISELKRARWKRRREPVLAWL